MTKDNEATKRVLALRQNVEHTKTRVTQARTMKTSAEDQLTAADDAIEELGLDPDRDLERQVNRLIEGIEQDLVQLKEQLDEAESVLGGNK